MCWTFSLCSKQHWLLNSCICAHKRQSEKTRGEKSSQEKKKVSILLVISDKTLKMAKRCNTSLKCRYVQHLPDSDLLCSEMQQERSAPLGCAFSAQSHLTTFSVWVGRSASWSNIGHLCSPAERAEKFALTLADVCILRRLEPLWNYS